MALKKENRNKILQSMMDNNKFTINFNFITEYKDIHATWKVLINLMLNDLYMNGFITWKQSTYADKMGCSRQHMSGLFKTLTDVGVLIPESTNKPGSKSNKYKISTHNIVNLKTTNKGFKEKPVNPSVLSCQPGFTQPVNPSVLSCQPQFTYNTSNKSVNTDLILKEEEPFVGSSSIGVEELANWAETLDI